MSAMFGVGGGTRLVKPVLKPHRVFTCVFFERVRERGVHETAVDFGVVGGAEHVGHVCPEHSEVVVVRFGRHANELLESHVPVVHLRMVFAEPLDEFFVGERPDDLFGVRDGLAVLEGVGVVVPCDQHHLRVVAAELRHVGAAVNRNQREDVVGCQAFGVLDRCGELFAVKRVAVHEGDRATLGVDNVAVGNVGVAGGDLVLFEVFLEQRVVVREQVVVLEERDDHLAESLVRNLHRVGEGLLAVVGGVELELGFFVAAAVFVAVERGDARLHFADEQVVLFVAPTRLDNDFLGAERNVLRHHVFAVECGLAEYADNARLVLVNVGVVRLEPLGASGQQGRCRKRNGKYCFLLHNADKYIKKWNVLAGPFWSIFKEKRFFFASVYCILRLNFIKFNCMQLNF